MLKKTKSPFCVIPRSAAVSMILRMVSRFWAHITITVGERKIKIDQFSMISFIEILRAEIIG